MTMAVPLHSTSYSSCLRSAKEVHHPSLSLAIQEFVGLRIQSPNSFGVAKLGLNAEFREKVHKTIISRSPDNKVSRARVVMMPIGTPRVPYRNPAERRWQWIDVWNALYRERIIFIGKYINEEVSNQLLSTMLYLDSIDDSKKLHMYISSPGGDLTPSLAVYDTMQSLKSPIGTHCLANALDLAAFILAAGDKGSRSAMPLSIIELQTPGGAARGKADDIRNEAGELLRIRDYLFKELSEKTGQPIEKVREDLKMSKQLKSHEAVEYGLIDRVLKPARVKANAAKKQSTEGLG